MILILKMDNYQDKELLELLKNVYQKLIKNILQLNKLYNKNNNKINNQILI